MNTDEGGESSVFADSEYRNKDPQATSYTSSVDLDMDPFQRLGHHFSSMNNRPVSVDKKKKLLSSHYENPRIARDFQDENSFNKALTAARICLKKEECSKKTACHFYSLIQSVAEHFSNIKEQTDDNIQKLNRIKLDSMDFTRKALDVCDEMNTILTLSYTEKVWDHLTESQKEDIENFRKRFSEFHKQLNEDCVLYEGIKVPDTAVVSSDPSCSSLKNKELQELLAEKNKLLTELAAMKEKRAKLQETNTEIDVASSYCQNQARLIAIISPFLYTHCLSGQTVAEISSYLKSLGYHINEQEIENILKSFPSLFRECQSSEGHADENRWTFCGYDL